MPCSSPGSSPRGRGTRAPSVAVPEMDRFIPAWAGNTAFWELFRIKRPVHPRVGGEHAAFSQLHNRPSGSSPRGRGTLKAIVSGYDADRFIPAWAGNTAIRQRKQHEQPVHPRVGGEHIRYWRERYGDDGSSPRGRGTLDLLPDLAQVIRFIPAWAGNTSIPLISRSPEPVHPRVGGEHPVHRVPQPFACGSSPRGRGTLACFRWRHVQLRFIPAWAGNTDSRHSWSQ